MDLIKDQLSNLNRLNYEELITLVDDISKCPDEEQQNKCWELLVKQDFLQNQLNKVVSNPDSKIIEFIADSCKNTICRKFFTKDFFINCLLDLIGSSNYEIIKQSCRSINNICYDNGNAVSMVFNYNGILKIVDLLKSEKLKNRTIDEKIALKKIIFGCLLNLFNVRPECQRIALNNDLINLMIKALEMDHNRLNQDSLVSNCVQVLLCILDNESPENEKSLKNSKLICNLVDQLASLNLKQIQTLDKIENVDLETVESIIDLLVQISRDEDKIRAEMVERGVIEVLIEILDHELIKTEQILKVSSDLLVTLLYEEPIVKQCYNNGKGTVYLKIKHWLNIYIQQLDENSKSNDEIDVEKQSDRNASNLSDNLIERDDFIQEKTKPKNSVKENFQLMTSALVISNFISNDEDAIAICKDGLIDKLVKISESNDSILIQLACLSTLGNLAIPEQNKKHFIKNKLLIKLLRLAHSESPPIVSKLIKILRLITDKQPDAAFQIVNDHSLIDNLKIWTNLNNVIAVKSEASRLLASLFKNLENLTTDHNHLINKELLQSLFEMVNSEHLQMQSEAISGIGFLINKFEPNQVVHEFLKNKFLIDIESLLGKYNNKENLNEFESKFVQNILSVLSFGCLKYSLELNNDLYQIVENLSFNHPYLTATTEVLLRLKENRLSVE